MRLTKMLFAAVAVVAMTFSAEAAKTAKAVEVGKTLTFVYDEADYGTNGIDWYSVAEAESIVDFDVYSVPWSACGWYVTNVVFDASFKDYRPKQCGGWFSQFANLERVEGLENLDTSEATGFRCMFYCCSSLKTLDISGFNTSKVTDMAHMFDSSNLTALDLSSFDTSKVTDMECMFAGCDKLKSIYVTDAFVVDQVTKSYLMFDGCTSLMIGGKEVFDSDKVDKTYARIDEGPSSRGYFARPSLAVKAALEDNRQTLRFLVDNQYHGARGKDWFSVVEAEAIVDPGEENVPWYGIRTTVDRVVFDESFAEHRPVSVANWFYDFNDLIAVDGIAFLDTSRVTTFSCMFSGCSSLTSLDVSGFDTSNANDLSGMFADCSSLGALDVSGFVTSKVTDMAAMFSGCSSLTSLDVTGFDTSNVECMYYMFFDCSSLSSLDVTRFRTPKVTEMYCMFCGNSLLTSLDLTGFDTAMVTDMTSMFAGCSSLKTITVTDAFVTTAVVGSDDMFDGCDALKGGNGTAYDSTKTDKAYARTDEAGTPGYFTGLAKVAKVVREDSGKTFRFVYDNVSHGAENVDWFAVPESNWDSDSPWKSVSESVNKVVFADSFKGYRPRSCSCWFRDFAKLATIEGLGNLDTSEVTGMSCMFLGCTSLTSIDISRFNMAKVTDWSNMFDMVDGCSSLRTVKLPDTITAIDECAFRDCIALETVDLPTGIAEIKDSAFIDCTNLKTIDLPEGLKSIGNLAFYGCSSIKSVRIPASLEELDMPFVQCDSLTDFVVAADNPRLTSVDGVVYDKAMTRLVAYPSGRAGTYSVPEGMTRLNDAAFAFSRVETVHLPVSVNTIEGFLVDEVMPVKFFMVTHLRAITVDPANPYFTSVDGVLYDKAMSKVISCPMAMTRGVRIPSGVVEIDGAAFFCCNAQFVAIPKTVGHIGIAAFWISDEMVGDGLWHGVRTFYVEPGDRERVSNLLQTSLATDIRMVTILEGEPPVDPDPVSPDPVNPDPVNPTGTVLELYASPASTPFTGDASYNGWVRGADGTIAGLLTIKAGKPAKPEKGGQSKLSIQYTPFGGKKQTIKLDKSLFPVAGGNPTVSIPGIGMVTFGGTSLAGAGLQMGKDLAKSKDKAEKTAANARLARKDGTWTFAVGTDAGYSAFSVTVKKGKGKLTGTLPDGTKVSVSSQGILGDKALAIPFAYSKKGALGFVFWVNDDGTTSISDLTALKLANGTTLAVKEQVAPSAALKLADGTRTFTVSGLGVAQTFAVAGKKWTLPKHVKKPTEEKPDLNPNDVKLKFTEKTGIVKGTFSVPNPATGKAVKYTVNGVVVDGVLYGAAFMKGGTPVPCEAE